MPSPRVAGPTHDERSLPGGENAFEEFEDDERPRFCSLDPPAEIFEERDFVRPRVITTHEEFSEACRRGQLKQVEAMVEHGGMDLSETNEDGHTVIHVAAAHRHCHEILAYLLAKGANLSRRDNSGTLPLHTAASHRNAAGIRQLLQFGAEVDAMDSNGCTPLFAACKAGAYRAIAALLEGGADPSRVDCNARQTPLHALLHTSQKRKASPTKFRRVSQNDQSTHGALSLRETVDIMIKAGAPLTAIDGSGQSVVDAAAMCDSDLLHHLLMDCDLRPTDALVHAIRNGDTPAAEKLLSGGKVDPRGIIDNNGSTLLHIAAAHGRLECAQLLLTGKWLQRHDSVPLNIDARDRAGRTALFNATLNAFLDLAAFLLDFGASPAIQDCTGAGVGYTFKDTVKTEHKIAICELLARWGSRTGEERERAESSMSVKAPGGEVIFFSGEVPFVHNSKTQHLWAPINDPPPPPGSRPWQAAAGEGVVVRNRGTNPWRGATLEAEYFHDIDSDAEEPTSQTNACSDDARENAKVRGAQQKEQRRGAAKYAASTGVPRKGREQSKDMGEEDEAETPERSTRFNSEPIASPEGTSPVKSKLGRKGSPRRGGRLGYHARDHIDGSSGQGDEPMEERLRVRSAASASSDTPKHSPIARQLRPSSDARDPPRNLHRKLRPLAMGQQHHRGKKAATGAEIDTPEEAPTSTLSPSAPRNSRPSRIVKTFL